MHVLIMRDHWQGALACVQSFGRRGHKVSLMVSPIISAIGRSDYVTALVPAFAGAEPAAHARYLIDQVIQLGFDLVVPISDDDALAVALAAEMAPDVGAFVTPSVAAVALCRDRNATADLCADLDIPVPRSATVTRATALDAAEEIGFPCFLKLSETLASAGVFRVDSAEALGAHLHRIPEPGCAQIQENIEGTFVGLGGVAIDGRLKVTVGFEVDERLQLAGTPAFCTPVDGPALDAVLQKITRHLNWSGGIDLDMIRRADGTHFLLEINPRMSGSINVGLAMGRDLPAAYLEAVGGDAGDPVFPPKSFDTFVHVVEEARLFRDAGGRDLARIIRGQGLVADNGYPDDSGYARLVQNQVRKIKRKAFLRHILGRGDGHGQ
ncbi:carbamoyl phosphate synthase-like protein [Shimia sp. SK013]|uniref:ATP-grasp domain-containing protein n=1 Tax=Shimia sp. SK013 TaxID=1389006 RepID=UPI0006CE20DD|nr:hypothetical protein [Shimia sp. SK013]KPA23271.1 carbamoyl phosphate synthase-like protein [Shimia sp. SK013]